MTDGDRRERLHQRIWELLPWYANGTLPDGERRTVETHLAGCPRCRTELADCQRLGEALRRTDEAAPSVHPAQLSRLLARIEEIEAAEPGGVSTRIWRGLGAPLRALRSLAEATPPLARGALVAQLVLLIVLAGLLVRWPRGAEAPAAEPAYRTLSQDAPAPGAPEPTARLRLVFAGGTTEREIRDLLLGIRGQIVRGPSPLGVYTVEVPAGPDPIDKVLEHLRSRPGVSLAEPAVGDSGGGS